MRSVSQEDAWKAISARLRHIEMVLILQGIESATITHVNDEPDYGASIALTRDGRDIPDSRITGRFGFSDLIHSELPDGNPAFFEISEIHSGLDLKEMVYHVGEEIAGYIAASTGTPVFDGFTIPWTPPREELPAGPEQPGF